MCGPLCSRVASLIESLYFCVSLSVHFSTTTINHDITHLAPHGACGTVRPFHNAIHISAVIASIKAINHRSSQSSHQHDRRCARCGVVRAIRRKRLINITTARPYGAHLPYLLTKGAALHEHAPHRAHDLVLSRSAARLSPPSASRRWRGPTEASRPGRRRSASFGSLERPAAAWHAALAYEACLRAVPSPQAS